MLGTVLYQSFSFIDKYINLNTFTIKYNIHTTMMKKPITSTQITAGDSITR